MNPEPTLPERIQDLADGALAFDDRARLLRSLDLAEPERWREVALAFVERDILTEAVAARSHRRPVASTGAWLAAACVALGCFLLGWMARPGETAVSAVATESSGAEAEGPEYPLPSPALLREANAQLAPTGYEASMLTRYVRTNFDGREVVIPVSQVRLDYRGL